jgi:hypothetical protein
MLGFCPDFSVLSEYVHAISIFRNFGPEQGDKLANRASS